MNSPRLSSGTAVGLLIAAALFYVGHGLHDGEPAPAFVSNVQAQEAAPPKEANFRWEGIAAEQQGTSLTRTSRAKIPGGWLVRIQETTFGNNGRGVSVGLSFVPDPEHKWDGKSLP